MTRRHVVPASQTYIYLYPPSHQNPKPQISSQPSIMDSFLLDSRATKGSSARAYGLGCHAYNPNIRTAFGYRPSLAAGIVFVILFSLITIAHIVQVGISRKWWYLVFVAGALGEYPLLAKAIVTFTDAQQRRRTTRMGSTSCRTRMPLQQNRLHDPNRSLDLLSFVLQRRNLLHSQPTHGHLG